MTLSSEIVGRMVFWLEKIDEHIDKAKQAAAHSDETEALGEIEEAEWCKRRVIVLSPPPLKEIYDIFFYADLAAAAARSWPNMGPLSEDGITIDDVIEDLEQSLDDIEYFLEVEDYSDAAGAALEDLAEWLRQMIKHFRTKAPKPADQDKPDKAKGAYFETFDSSGDLGHFYGDLEIIDVFTYFARRLLVRATPDFTEASGYLAKAEDQKYQLLDFLRRRVGKQPGPPQPGQDDLPKDSGHA